MHSGLILSRTKDEGITIKVPPSDTETIVHVTTLSCTHSRARLRIAAPHNTSIIRDEILKSSKEGDAA
ncbi:hypothetical protein DN730_09735 [Marinomonas piezotolerans]|uniref:Carbon storage regulator n=1 Tax=Marinomonas piezotolerans TaxID=2213058 RepID=A0A370UA35_9GAMM|nr:carbon storage regulator [Marinomonas piezotolerans]RDL44656.1 hypothetical protein DN730_09735 [Marinomonas piezotolerans]